ncbi:MAG: hypothetical protein R3E01_29290 [Pirellulaceae bacterium]|nr:hypothetical protein [Planctomycetales bacterium]
MQRNIYLAIVVIVCLMPTERVRGQGAALFLESFDSVPLRPPVDEDSNIQRAFSHVPPPGWIIDSDGVPSIGDPSIGVTEWEGWSITNFKFWTEVAGGNGDGPRDQFKSSSDSVIVADPDQWNDRGNPAEKLGPFKSALYTPKIPIHNLVDGASLNLRLDNSWLPGEKTSNGDSQQARIAVSFDGGPFEEIERWDSDPESPFFKPPALDEALIWSLDLPKNASDVVIQFLIGNAGDGGFWAMDQLMLISGCGAAVGDMTQDCVYESDDVDAFIEALRDVDGYNSSHSFPRHQVGDLTADFEMNFADIPGFVAKMNEEGVAVTVPSLIAAINGVPEPNLGMFFLVVSVAMLIGTRRCRDRA